MEELKKMLEGVVDQLNRAMVVLISIDEDVLRYFKLVLENDVSPITCTGYSRGLATCNKRLMSAVLSAQLGPNTARDGSILHNVIVSRVLE